MKYSHHIKEIEPIVKYKGKKLRHHASGIT